MMQLLLKRKAKPKLPHFTQKKDYTCGPACMKMVLHTLGIWVAEEDLEKELGTTRQAGTPNLAFPAMAEKRKLSYCVGRGGTIQDLRSLQRRGFKVIVGYFLPDFKEGHFAVVRHIGWWRILLSDPLIGPDHAYPMRYFQTIWHNDPEFDAEEGWYFAVKK